LKVILDEIFLLSLETVAGVGAIILKPSSGSSNWGKFYWNTSIKWIWVWGNVGFFLRSWTGEITEKTKRLFLF
jgi:hypothetical protein